jgi:hypothetical protein
MENGNIFLVVTREKTPPEVDEFHDWLDENYIATTYAGQLSYWVEGAGDATLVKLFWGA